VTEAAVLPVVPSLAEPSPPARGRGRFRLLLLVGLGVLWGLPWIGDQRASDVVGAWGLLAFAGAFAAAAAGLLATTRRGLALGETLVGLVLPAAATALIATRHPWFPGGDRRASWVPIFGPLAGLALVDLVVRLRRLPERGEMGREITAIRAASALLAAAALYVALEPLPAVLAGALGLVPAFLHWTRRAANARRVLEALSLLCAVGLLLAPDLQGASVPRPLTSEVGGLLPYAWRAAAATLVVVGLVGVFAPEGRPDPTAET
jgi:hypothetical protein